jgi:hypothetical protein
MRLFNLDLQKKRKPQTAVGPPNRSTSTADTQALLSERAVPGRPRPTEPPRILKVELV